MRDGVGVPSLREHRDGDDAADRFAEAVFLADSVHDFAKKALVGEVFGLLPVAGALDDLSAKTLDLVGGHGAEVVVESLAGFKLFAINQQGVGPRERIAVLVEVERERGGRCAAFRFRPRSCD